MEQVANSFDLVSRAKALKGLGWATLGFIVVYLAGNVEVIEAVFKGHPALVSAVTALVSAVAHAFFQYKKGE